jgi:hypothetical protein
MAEEVSAEQARVQAWEVMLAKARQAQYADPKAVAAAKTLLEDPAWKEAIEVAVTASPVPETAGTDAATAKLPDGRTEVPWQVVYPGYINGELAFGVPFDEAMTEAEGSLVIENIQWGTAASA